jgi:hypothetical protein
MDQQKVPIEARCPRSSRQVLIPYRRELARLIPGAELHLMPGGHLAVLRAQADAYAERI